ncbi:efflux RND transporter periplasmic adaptor subunit [Candidatus Magnetaquicoccus inordinatus]|uniref:efflux RND transporter periplasmic adaptor subunit n=1 Tax=Candidatus Magnetaquicoccus inordinatus TaxID=2496818 RepID=UPI00102C3565|nr:efflux RND transporter periplasmic adaptor subunit [Candidatus Magnetaquicoccus inordinatus]
MKFWLPLCFFGIYCILPAGAAERNLPPPAPTLAAVNSVPAGEVSCLIEPSVEVNVGSPADGSLDVVHVDRGDIVNRGQLLAKLDTAVQVAAANVLEAKAAYGSRKYRRNEDLQKQQLISSQELDEIATEQRLAELELKERREQILLRSIISPIRGVIVDRYRNRGDLVKQEKIFRIAQLDPLHVETVVPASYFGRIHLEQSYEVTPQLVGGKMKARVSTIDRVIDAASGTFRVRLLLANPQYELPPGQRCSVNFNPNGTNP